MYTLAVGAVFKNEQHALKEWLDHYIHHGVEHFYLINDASTDSSLEIVKPYIDKGLVTLYSPSVPYYLGRQKDLYNTYILPHLKETQWLLMVDLDEFMWSPRSIDLNDVLKYSTHLGQIQVEHTLFGSNGHISIPNGIVKSYTKRALSSPTRSPGLRKYFVNSAFRFSELTIHHARFVDIEDEQKRFILLDENYFVLNHYCCQAMDFWRLVKCTRGDCDNYRLRTMNDFTEVDQNDVEDLRLVEQNKLVELSGISYRTTRSD